MKDSDRQIDRLLRAAVVGEDAARDEMPFGFDTRVLAGWRLDPRSDLLDLGRLFRRVILISLGVIALAGAGFYHELSDSDTFGESLGNEYAIADSAISSAVEP